MGFEERDEEAKDINICKRDESAVGMGGQGRMNESYLQAQTGTWS